MKPSFDDSKPVFQSIAEWLEDAVLAEIYPEESKVPSITEISVQYNLNPATALKGINLLVDGGILYKKRGVGMFVVTGAREKLLLQRRKEFLDEYIIPLLGEAKRLGLSTADLKSMIARGELR